MMHKQKWQVIKSTGSRKNLPVTTFICDSNSIRTDVPWTSTTRPLYPLKGPIRILMTVPTKESFPPLPPLYLPPATLKKKEQFVEYLFLNFQGSKTFLKT
ncbi:hypothetical protein HanIR_Chr04g0169401 [Helianthus annuus]|nr:hypothetical protein HanIR_Chr04g0169401 [Helianthus annuus]